MKRANVFLLILIASFIVAGSLFASGITEMMTSGTIDGGLHYLSRNTMDNKSLAMKLDDEVTVNTIMSSLNSDFDSSSPNQALFRLIDNLYSQDNVSGIRMKITSNNGWNFISEDNPSYTRPFKLCTIQNVSTYNNSVATHQYGSFSESKKTMTYNDGYYILTLPTSNSVTVTNWSLFNGNRAVGMVPSQLIFLDLCIYLESNAAKDLIGGYYYTDISYEIIDEYYTHTVKQSGERFSLEKAEGPPISGTFRVWGYIGSETVKNSASYSFNVSETNDTYSMDLAPAENTYYNVALINFHYADVVNSEPDTEMNESKFKIYISPGTDYNKTTYTAEDYCFKKINTENKTRTDENTVYYSLFKNTTQNGTFSTYDGHPYVYEITPSYEDKKIADVSTVGGGSKQWSTTWTLEGTPVYLRITDDSFRKEHLSGLYTSTLYFTLVAN